MDRTRQALRGSRVELSAPSDSPTEDHLRLIPVSRNSRSYLIKGSHGVGVTWATISQSFPWSRGIWGFGWQIQAFKTGLGQPLVHTCASFVQSNLVLDSLQRPKRV